MTINNNLRSTIYMYYRESTMINIVEQILHTNNLDELRIFVEDRLDFCKQMIIKKITNDTDVAEHNSYIDEITFLNNFDSDIMNCYGLQETGVFRETTG